VQKLKPTIESIKAQYGDDKKAIQRETSALYESSGVNPTAGEHATAAMMPTAIQCSVALRMHDGHLHTP